MELNFHYAQSCRVTTRSESTDFLVYLLLSCAVTQAIDEFVLELGLKESNSKKRRKLTSLALNEDEWVYVRLFCHVLQVRTLSCTLTLLMHGFIQHQMMLSKLSPPPQLQVSKMHSQYWRGCTRRGRRPQAKTDTCISFRLSTREWRSSTSTTNALRHRMPISWLWVNVPPSLIYRTDQRTSPQSLTPRRKWAISQNTGQQSLSKKSKKLSGNA